jgi:hypothetical protein
MWRWRAYGSDTKPRAIQREYCLAHRVHVTSPRRLPRGAAARMEARNEAWQEGPAGKQAVPERPRRWLFAIGRPTSGLSQLQPEIIESNLANALTM